MKCKLCDNEATTKGGFCSRNCVNKHNSLINRSERNRKISQTIRLIEPNKRKIFIPHEYACEKCNVEFKTRLKIRKGRKIHCLSCRKKVLNKEPDSILELSSRTVSKILKRAKKACSICGWNSASCDIHHIIPRSQNGSNELNNLIILCPNHHREAHEGKIELELMQKNNIELTFSNWKEFYRLME